MLKSFVWLALGLFIVISETLCAKNIVIGQSHQLESAVLKEKRPYSVYLPPSYLSSKDKRYPVIYLLDGDDTRLKGFSGLIESLSSDNLEQQIPEFIIVAIANTKRTRDLTPTKTNLIYKGKLLAELKETGGADNFLQFIKTELISKIDLSYRTNNQRALVGSSFAGLFAAHVLMSEPDLFSDYLIIDATYVWDNNYLNRLSSETLAKVHSTDIRVFLALANNDHIGEHGVANQQWGRDFVEKLKNIDNDNLTVNFKYFNEERHGTVDMQAWYFGILSLFKH